MSNLYVWFKRGRKEICKRKRYVYVEYGVLFMNLRGSEVFVYEECFEFGWDLDIDGFFLRKGIGVCFNRFLFDLVF